MCDSISTSSDSGSNSGSGSGSNSNINSTSNIPSTTSISSIGSSSIVYTFDISTPPEPVPVGLGAHFSSSSGDGSSSGSIGSIVSTAEIQNSSKRQALDSSRENQPRKKPRLIAKELMAAGLDLVSVAPENHKADRCKACIKSSFSCVYSSVHLYAAKLLAREHFYATTTSPENNFCFYRTLHTLLPDFPCIDTHREGAKKKLYQIVSNHIEAQPGCIRTNLVTNLLEPINWKDSDVQNFQGVMAGDYLPILANSYGKTFQLYHMNFSGEQILTSTLYCPSGPSTEILRIAEVPGLGSLLPGYIHGASSINLHYLPAYVIQVKHRYILNVCLYECMNI